MRLADESDCPAIERKLLWMLKANPEHQMQYADTEVAFAYVRQAMREGRAYYLDGYFIMVDVGSDWYTSRKYLIEQIILKIHPTTSPVSVAIAALDRIREIHGCVAIAAGDTQVGYMTPHYHAAGYITLGTQLFKGEPNGIHSQVDRG